MNNSNIKLSIIIPVYNEEKTVEKIIKRVYKSSTPQVTKEIIVVDDGSSDQSAKIIQKLKKSLKFEAVFRSENNGKGAAIRSGIGKATGDFILIQDADLEYDPKQIPRLLTPVLSGRAEVVYGTRLNRLPDLSRDERIPLFLLHYAGNRFLSLVTSILYGQWITDMETCYKLFPKSAVNGMEIEARGFEFEPEITAKLIKKGYRIHEVPIRTIPRGYEEGKKLDTVRDGIRALTTLLKYRFS